MPSPTLIATVGDARSNSYIDLATATLMLTGIGEIGAWNDGGGPFISTRLYAAADWNAASDDDKIAALIWATALLDQFVDWNGYKATREQALRWPRSGVYDPDNFYVPLNIIPVRIMEITAQLAWELIKVNRLQEPATTGLGVDSVTVGPIQAAIDPNQAFAFIPKYLQAMLAQWGILNGMASGSGGMIQAKLLRT